MTDVIAQSSRVLPRRIALGLSAAVLAPMALLLATFAGILGLLLATGLVAITLGWVSVILAFVLVVVAVTLAVVALAGDIGRKGTVATGSFGRILNVSDPVALEVTNGAGSISIRSGNAAQVRIVGKIRIKSGRRTDDCDAREAARRLSSNPPIELNGNTVRIGEVRDGIPRKNVSIRYELVVPAGTRLRVDVGTGSISAHGLTGALTARTGAGNIVVHDMCGDIAVETGAGDVKLIGISGRLSARVGSGSIDAAGTPMQAWRLHSGAGNVTLRLPADTGFELDASTGIGAIATSHPLMASGELDNRALRGVTRAGGPLISASAGVGSIRIE